MSNLFMKTLNLHTDYIKFKPLKKAIKNIGELSEAEKKEQHVKEALAVMTAVEKGDSNIKNVVEKLVESIKEIAEQINIKNIVLYPYAHLSSELASPQTAMDVLEGAEKILKKSFNVVKAPFGYYKEFEMKVKGHPLSELSREFKIEGNEEESELDEKERTRLWKIMSKNKVQVIRGKNDLKSNVELGRDLDLYIVNEIVGQGLPLLTPKGASIKREIERFITDEEIKRGYEHTSTPILAKSDLYKISGHWQHYKDDMFTMKVGKEEFALRPMTCPFQFVLYKRKPRSYKDLPKKYGEVATLFRNEQSGELRGLTRLRQFTLADGHIICTPEQMEEEFKNVMDLLNYIIKTFDIEGWYQFSKWDPKNENNKYVDNPEAWEKTQNSMKKILDNLKIEYVEKEGEAAFYGPKLDLQYKDVYGKEDTLITIQMDFALPDKFNLTYLDKNNKEKKPMVIHRSSTGATERLMSYILEKTQGSLPLWLSPIQVKIVTTSQNNDNYAKKINNKLIQNKIRCETDFSDDKIGKKVRNAYIEKAFYILTIGDKEAEENIVAIKQRGEKDVQTFGVDEFVEKVKGEIRERV